MRDDRVRVVVTGIGAVSGFGWGVDSLHRSLLAAETAIREPRGLDLGGQRTRLAGEVPPPPRHLADGALSSPQLSRADRFAIAATDEAVGQAGLDTQSTPTGVYFGGSTAGMLECEEYVGRLFGVRAGRPRISMQASQQINGPGDAVARHRRATGPVLTVSSACASGTLAIGAALDAIRAGDVEAAITGGADSLCVLTYSGFNALRSVDERPCRPFRADRQGLSIGEGAGVLVLESLEAARARGAHPVAEVLGAGASCDAHHMTAPHPDGDGAAAAMVAALDDAGVTPETINLINAHGTGTPHNDVAEGRAIAAVFGERGSRIPLSATKAAVGHLLGSSGAIEAVATILGIMHHLAHPVPGSAAIDPEIDVDLVVGEPRPLPEHVVALSTSLAFGGANAAVVLGTLTGDWRA